MAQEEKKKIEEKTEEKTEQEHRYEGKVEGEPVALNENISGKVPEFWEFSSIEKQDS